MQLHPQSWEEFAAEYKARGPLQSDKRVCAVCLRDVDRASYLAHLNSHGYETLHVYPQEAA